MAKRAQKLRIDNNTPGEDNEELHETKGEEGQKRKSGYERSLSNLIDDEGCRQRADGNDLARNHHMDGDAPRIMDQEKILYLSGEVDA